MAWSILCRSLDGKECGVHRGTWIAERVAQAARHFLVVSALSCLLAMSLTRFVVAGPAVQPPPQEPAPPLRPVATMSDLMAKFLYPAMDSLFYIETRTPANTAEWNTLEGQTLMIAEAANILMLPGRARDQDQWMTDAKLLLDAGAAALKAVKARDVAAIVALNEQLVASCSTCHRHYRPNYGRRP